MNESGCWDSSKKGSLITEITGITGAGKTTVIKWLSKMNSDVIIDYRLPRVRSLSRILLTTIMAAPLVGIYGNHGWKLTGLKQLVYLDAMVLDLFSSKHRFAHTLVLDQGPVYLCAALSSRVFGSCECKVLRARLSRAMRLYGNTVDAIFWLDSSDKRLFERFINRNRHHALKLMSKGAIYEFFSNYRIHYQSILEKLESVHNVPVVRIDTERLSPLDVASQVFAFLEGLQTGRNI